MMHPDITLEKFRSWLVDTGVDAIPCSGEHCILAKWLEEDVEFTSPHVDEAYMESVPPGDEPVKLRTPAWAKTVIRAFDDLAPKQYPGPGLVHAPIPPERYREPLLTLCNKMITIEGT